MVTKRMHRRTTAACIARYPDDGVVVATALLALATLVVMLCAAVG